MLDRKCPSRILVTTVAAAAFLCLLTGCYERVVSERGFAGMASRRNVATAPDYSGEREAFEERYRDQTQPDFDPFGDFGRWISRQFSSDDKPERASQGTATAPSNTGTSPAPAPSNTDSSKSSFNPAP